MNIMVFTKVEKIPLSDPEFFDKAIKVIKTIFVAQINSSISCYSKLLKNLENNKKSLI